MLLSRKDGKRALLDYIAIDKYAKERFLDVFELRGVAGGMPDHCLVETRFSEQRKCCK